LTQLRALSTGPRQSSGKQGFELRVFNRLGNSLVTKYYSSDTLDGSGILDGFTSRRYPSGNCGQCDFNAKPNAVRIEAGSILELTFDTGTTAVPVHFGTVVTNPDGREGLRGEYESAGGKELLKRSICGPDALYDFQNSPVDVAQILRTLVSSYKHPALKYSQANYQQYIPDTGVLAGRVDARGRNLYEAIEGILEAVPAIGEHDWGADAEGYVVIRPPTGEINKLYSSVMTQFGDITSDGVVTKATILVANAVSEGAIVSAGYVPSLITHSYEHPEHAEWKAERSFSIEEKDGRAVLDVLRFDDPAGAGHSGWATPSGSVGGALTDGNPETYAYPTSSVGYIYTGDGSINKSTRYVGAVIVVDAPTGSYDLAATITYESYVYNPANPNSVTSTIVRAVIRFDMNTLKGRGKVAVRFVAPPPAGFFVEAGMVEVRPTGTVPTSLKVYELNGLILNTTLLTQIARAQIRLPAKEVSEVTFAHGVDPFTGYQYGAHLLEQPAKRLNLLSDTGKDLGLGGDIAEIVDTYTTDEGMLSRVALGAPIRNPIIRALTR